jgi:hypothetical protein
MRPVHGMNAACELLEPTTNYTPVDQGRVASTHIHPLGTMQSYRNHWSKLTGRLERLFMPRSLVSQTHVGVPIAVRPPQPQWAKVHTTLINIEGPIGW